MALEVRDLRFGYGGNEPLFRDFSALFAPGSITAVLGPNGSGKTTFLKVLLGLLEPSGGEVLLGERSIGSMEYRERAEKISYLPQRGIQPQEWSLRELVEKGGYAASDGSKSLKQRMDDAGERLELGTMWERRLSTLSGGELQRGLIARSIVQDCPVLIMDEPMNHLDLSHRLKICELFAALSKEGRTVIYAVHDFNISIQFDHRIFVLAREGRFIEAPREREAMESLLRETYSVDFSSVDIQDFSYYYPKKNGRQ